MERHLLRKGPAYAKALSKVQVDRRLQGPSRNSEGLVKHDHQSNKPIIHFTHGQYDDAFVSSDELHIRESRFPGENAKLRCQMDDLTRREKVMAIRTLKGSGGAAVLFSLTIKKQAVGAGWTANLAKLPVEKRDRQEEPQQSEQTKESKRFRSYFRQG